MKKILIAFGVFVALILAAAAILPFVIDINDIVAGQIPKVEGQIHRDISIGDVKLTVLTGLGAEIRNVRISNSPDFQKSDFVSIDSLKAKVRLLPLLKKEVLVSSILIDKPAILIERNARGIFNFSDMLTSTEAEKETKKEPAADPASEDSLKSLENILISKISIQDGNFTFIDAAGGGASREIRLEKLNLAMKAVSLFQKIHLDFEADVSAGARAGHVALVGEIGPIGNKPAPENIEMDLTLTLDDINFPHLASYIKGMNIKTGGMDVKTTVKGRVQDKLQCRVDINCDKLDMVLGDAATTDAPTQSVFIDGSWQITADISGPVKAPAVAGKNITAEDLNFKANVDAVNGSIAFGNVFQKDSGTPLSLSASGRLQENALRIEDLKFVLSRIVLSANADILNFADPLIDGRAAIASAPLDALAPILPLLKTYDLKGTIELSDARFRGKIDELKNLQGVSGSLTIQNGSAVSAELGKKIEKIQATVTVADNAIRISNTSIRIDASDATINATVRNPTKPDITFNLASSYLDVDSLLPPPSDEKKEPESKSPETGTTEKKKAPDMRVDGKISITKCKYNKLMLDNVSAQLQYADAVATLTNVSFDTFEGNITTSAVVNLADMASPRWSADMAIDNINTNATLSQLTGIKDTIYGNFNGKLSLQGKGADWNVISKNLSGSGSSGIVNGKLAKVNVLDAVGQSLLKFPGLSLVAGAVSPETEKHLKETAFSDLSGTLNIRDGKILLDALNMSTKDFKLSGAGNIGLDKSLDLKAVLVLSKAASERLEKDKVMKYLLNKDQLLEIPCAFTGDVTSPRITADGDSLNRLLRNAVQDQIRKGVGDKLGQEAGQILEQLLK